MVKRKRKQKSKKYQIKGVDIYPFVSRSQEAMNLCVLTEKVRLKEYLLSASQQGVSADTWPGSLSD